MTKTALYRHYDAEGALLYVGISGDPEMRMRAHARTAEWPALVARTEAEWFACRDDALAAEKSAIQSEEPKHNATHRAFPRSEPAGAGWRERLAAEVAARRISMRSASCAAGLGPNFLREVLSGGKDPSISNLFSICAGAGIDPRLVLFGVPEVAGQIGSRE